MSKISLEEGMLIDLERHYNFRKFEVEYLIKKKLSEVPGFADFRCSPEVEEEARRLGREAAESMDKNIQIGQIRLLSGPKQPTWFAVLKEWGDDMFVVTPFSHYKWPAIDTEFKVRSDGKVTDWVLQCWHIQTLFRKTLERSWLTGELEQPEIENALLLWNSTFADVEIPAELQYRTGPEASEEKGLTEERAHLILEYQESEMDNLSLINSKDLQLLDEENEETEEKPEQEPEERIYYVTDWPFGRQHEVLAKSEEEAAKKFLRDNAGAPMNKQVEVASISTVPSNE